MLTIAINYIRQPISPAPIAASYEKKSIYYMNDYFINLKTVAKERSHPRSGFINPVLQAMWDRIWVLESQFQKYLQALLNKCKSTNAGDEAPVEPKKKKRTGGNDSIELRREKSQLQLPVKKKN